MSNPVELSRKFLAETGGWKEMKEARSIHAAGRISDASYRNGILEGMVRTGEKTLKVRMEVQSRIDVINHCPCFRTRRDGIICAHALAVGLEVLEPTVKAEPPKATAVEKEETPISPDWPEHSDVPEEASVPASLHLVLAPNLADAWYKGRVTTGIEVEIEGKRQLLTSVSAKTRLFLSSSDAALYRILQRISPAAVPGMLSLATDDLARIFAAIPGHDRVTLGKKTHLRLSHLAYRPNVRRGKGLQFKVDWPGNITPLISARGVWAMTEADLIQPVAPGLESRWQAVMVGGLTLDPANFANAFSALQTHFDTEAIEILRPQAEVRLEIEGSLNHLDAVLSFVYDDDVVSSSSDRPPVVESRGVLRLADTLTETKAIRELEEAGFTRRGNEGRWILKDKTAILQFLGHGYTKVDASWQMKTGERFDHALAQVEPIETRLDFRSSGEDWFAMEVGFGTGSGDSISRQEIDRLLQMGQTSKKLANGKVAVLNSEVADHFGEIISDCEPEQMQNGVYRIDQSQAGYLRETAQDFSFETSGAVPWQTTEGGIEFYDLSESLNKTLRPYQREGFTWMQQLAAQGMGGILADDMGLGKTLQTLSFLYSVGGTSLVVCPSSLVFNWVAEAEKFTPELKAVAIEGPNRAKVLAENDDADIFVTSYALLRRDEAIWQAREFDVVILDEAQHIKNPDAQVSKIAHRLQGTYRFALTGTPIENSVRDLWSISRFALPGYLGTRKDFAERFEKPLSTTQSDESVRERLSRRLKPVVLRRLKKEVAKDLPEKIEQVVYCDLKPKQKEVYEKLLRESKSSLLDAEGGKQRMLALTALLRLRQTCCDLRLLGLKDIEDSEASVKADTLNELLDEAIEGGHRVLIFSQFVEMLQVLVPDLAAKQIDFCYLDGQTKNRGEVVKRFQEKEVPVFLISLKAGGVGLNLTAADTVIHIDPWWNPAVETQATDRAHRIGQTNVVTSYKLITRGTVEEKILSLQNKKRAMTESLLSEAGDAGLSGDELMSLFD
ncbi:MAG: DEAD/DEAH box helicase [Verrucomicrobiales bacterium]|nr:DEAD/DEAH box helicase [Verrucomicrobiales bacterium]